jgi:hypothetical protein
VGLLNKPSIKPFFGIQELRLLLDLNYYENYCPENSSQHSIAWLLAFATAARPGSLCRSEGRTGYLKWANVQIFRQVGEKGAFFVKVTFEFWKRWADEDRKPYLSQENIA